VVEVVEVVDVLDVVVLLDECVPLVVVVDDELV
jgi:hypothetical protein